MDLLPNSYNGSRFRDVALPWLFDRIRERVAVDQFISPDGEHWDYRRWVVWAAMHGFVYIWPDPPTLGLIARPISKQLVEKCLTGEIPRDQILYAFDKKGDGLYMDFLWAPGQWNIVMSFLRATGKKWLGWQHKNTGIVHVRSICPDKESRKEQVPPVPADILELVDRCWSHA